MHVGFLERNSISLSDNDPARIWITHRAQENLVYIVLKQDEDLVSEILETRK